MPMERADEARCHGCGGRLASSKEHLTDMQETSRGVTSLAEAVRASKPLKQAYGCEALAADGVDGLYRVCHPPKVAVRQSPSLEAAALGLRCHGQIVAASSIIGPWIRLAVVDESESWMLTDGAGTKVSYAGRLLEPIEEPRPRFFQPAGCVDGTMLVRSPSIESPASLALCAAIAGGVCGGCDDGDLWRLLVGAPGSRWAVRDEKIPPRPSSGVGARAASSMDASAFAARPSTYSEQDAAAFGAPRLLLVLLDDCAGGGAGSEAATEAVALARAACAMCRCISVLVMPSQTDGTPPLASELLAALQGLAGRPKDYAPGTDRPQRVNDGPPSAGDVGLPHLAARRVVSGAGEKNAAAALSAASAIAIDDGSIHAQPMKRASGAWLRLHRWRPESERGSASERTGGAGRQCEACGRRMGGAPDQWTAAEHVAWERARSDAAAAGDRLSVLVSGGAYARQVAEWLREGGVTEVAFCSKGQARSAQRGARHERWMAAHGAANIDRASLWLTLKWGLGLELPRSNSRRAAGPREDCSAALDVSSGPVHAGFSSANSVEFGGADSGAPRTMRYERHTVQVALAQLRPQPRVASAGDWLAGGLAALNAAAMAAAAKGSALLIAPEAFLQVRIGGGAGWERGVRA